MKRNRVSLVGALGLLMMLSGCATPRVLVALRENHVRLGLHSAEVIRQTGQPDLWIAKRAVETLFYRNGDQAVFISLLDDKVVAYDDRAQWPAPAARGAKEASKPVSKGVIRVGMTEAQVRELYGKPDGMTAADGVETLHWVSGDAADSVVELHNGRVVGYVDMETPKYSQNVPRHNRKNSTTSGQVRVGMTRQEVVARLGKPDSVSARDGLAIDRYDSNAVFGNDLLYLVQYRNDRVVGFSQENLTLAKKERKEKEEQQQARENEQAQQESASRIRNVIFGFLLNAAVQEALGKRGVAGPAAPPRGSPPPTGRPPTGGPPPMRTTSCGCPLATCELAGKTRGLIVRVPSCSVICSGRAVCSCVGACSAERGFIQNHVCRCE